ncbi:MAG: citrate (Si)-synthase [Chlamydiales bacterium]
MSKVLFEITEDQLETGMRGYPVGYCVTSSADPQEGLSYVGKPVKDLAFKDPEEVIFLLLNGHEPSEEELSFFRQTLQQRSKVKEETLEAIRRLPRKGHPMKLFAASLLITGMIEGQNDYQEDCLNVIAKVPELVACVICHHADWKMNSSDPSLGYMENFAQMLNVPKADNIELTEVFRVFNVLHYDHGGGNLSAFTGKAVASGLEDMYGSLAASMCALGGPRHGKANQDCLEFVKEILSQVGENVSEETLEKLLRERLENKQLIFGFGHAVLRVEDPRATIFYTLAQQKYQKNPLVKIGLKLREVGPRILKENPKIADPYPNVDAISGTLLSAAGFAYPEYFTVLFGLARVVGIGIQVLYERCEAREGKGLPIIRPKYFYRSRS